MKFLKYFLLWIKHFFMYFGAWSMFYMINNIKSEYSLKGLISSSFFALVLSFIVIISDILKDKNKKSDHWKHGLNRLSFLYTELPDWLGDNSIHVIQTKSTLLNMQMQSFSLLFTRQASYTSVMMWSKWNTWYKTKRKLNQAASCLFVQPFIIAIGIIIAHTITDFKASFMISFIFIRL